LDQKGKKKTAGVAERLVKECCAYKEPRALIRTQGKLIRGRAQERGKSLLAFYFKNRSRDAVTSREKIRNLRREEKRRRREFTKESSSLKKGTEGRGRRSGDNASQERANRRVL